jgi:hypothetical protein
MTTFSDQFKKILSGGNYGHKGVHIREGQSPFDKTPRCSMCREYKKLNEQDLCFECQTDADRGYTVSAKAGRCANGAERDSGSLFHARLLTEHGAEWKPVCGSAPGPRSAGWSIRKGQPVTCKRCLKKLERINHEDR